MKLRGNEKHAAVHLQAWWRSQMARLAAQRVKKAERIKRQKIQSAAALVIQRTVARGCAGRRRFYEARTYNQNRFTEPLGSCCCCLSP